MGLLPVLTQMVIWKPPRPNRALERTMRPDRQLGAEKLFELFALYFVAYKGKRVPRRPDTALGLSNLSCR